MEQLLSIGNDNEVGLATFRLAVEACPSGIIVVDDSDKIILANKEIERLFGYESEELHNQLVEILLPEKARRAHTHQRHDYRLQPSPRHMGTGREFSGRHKDGHEIPIEVGLNPFQIESRVFVLCAVVDISERKRIERLKDEFVSMVSHELRTPMTSIAASLGLLAGGKAGGLPEPAARLIEIAHKNCQRLIALLNEILDIKKIESGQMTLDIQPCDAQLLLGRAVEANHALAESHGVRIELETSPYEYFVRADADRFIQAVTNLLANAIHFSPRDQKVVVAIEKRGDKARISVRDHGPGIPADFKRRIFEKFSQADVATNRKGGTGLGLNITRQIVELMKGKVGFEDAVGGGAIFYFDLPVGNDLKNGQDSYANGEEIRPILASDGRPPAQFEM